MFPLGFQTVGRGCRCWGGTSLPCPVPALLRMDSSCRTISTGEPICSSRAKCLQGEEPLTSPRWVPAAWQGWGGSAGALSLPIGEEAAVPDTAGACAGLQGSLDHKHLCLCRAHCLLLDAQGRLGAAQPGVSLVSESPLPPGDIPVLSPLPLPTSHPGIPNLSPPSHRPSRLAAHVAGGAEVAVAVDGWEGKAGGHCLSPSQHPQQQEAGALQEPPPQLGLAVGEAVTLWLHLQRDLAASWDRHSSSSPRDRGTPGGTGRLCCPLPGCDPALNLTSPSCRVFVTVIPCWCLTTWVLFSVGYGLSCGTGGGSGWRVEPGLPSSELGLPSTCQSRHHT